MDNNERSALGGASNKADKVVHTENTTEKPQGTGIWTVADAIKQKTKKKQKKQKKKSLDVNDLCTHNTQN